MALKLEPLQAEELDDFVKLHWDAFEPPEANMILPMIYPNGLEPNSVFRMRSKVLNSVGGGDLGSSCFCVKDTTTGEMVAVSWWAVISLPRKTKEEIDSKFEEISKARNAGPQVDMNKELDHAFFKAGYYSENESMDGKSFMSLRLLATHPKHQRRGAGSMLLKQGLEKANKSGLPVYLDAGVNGKPLYERFGFKVVKEFPLNCLEYGGRSNGEHWCMLRPAQSHDLNSTS